MQNIAVLNESTELSNIDVQSLVPALQAQWNNDLLPIWHVEPATLTFIPKGQTIPAGSWWLVFLDNSDQASALAYHDLTSDGYPLSKVFVKTLLADNASISVGASHELCEMAVDPWLNGAFQDRKGIFWASEICDPVEDDQYGYKIGNILVSNFVTPEWYAHKFSQGAIDFKGFANNAFQVLSGGYAQRFIDGGWDQVTGEQAALRKMAQPQQGSRRDRRSRRTTIGWTKSAPTDRPIAHPGDLVARWALTDPPLN